MDNKTYFKLIRQTKEVGDCQIWKGYTRNKLPAARINGNLQYLHQAFYEYINNTTLTSDDRIMHSCGNSCCLNPDHLICGNTFDHAQLKIERQQHAFGSKHGLAKLTEEDVRDIRDMSNTHTTKEIAQIFDLSVGHTSAIIRKIYWKHV